MARKASCSNGSSLSPKRKVHCDCLTCPPLPPIIFVLAFSSFFTASLISELSTEAKTEEPKTENPRRTITSSSVIVASPQGKTNDLVSGHHLSTRA
ncbi:hypothetical protein YC2023_075689 [Brassica napus]